MIFYCLGLISIKNLEQILRFKYNNIKITLWKDNKNLDTVNIEARLIPRISLQLLRNTHTRCLSKREKHITTALAETQRTNHSVMELMINAKASNHSSSLMRVKMKRDTSVDANATSLRVVLSAMALTRPSNGETSFTLQTC